jgi:hypothetical protein
LTVEELPAEHPKQKDWRPGDFEEGVDNVDLDEQNQVRDPALAAFATLAVMAHIGVAAYAAPAYAVAVFAAASLSVALHYRRCCDTPCSSRCCRGMPVAAA